MATTFARNPATPKYRKNTIDALHYQGNDWKRILDFYSDELKILSTRTTANSFTDFDNLQTELDRFQNIFNLLNKKIETLRHDIQVDEETIQKLVRENACHIKKCMLAADNRKLDRIKEVSDSIEVLQFSVNQFLTKNL